MSKKRTPGLLPELATGEHSDAYQLVAEMRTQLLALESRVESLERIREHQNKRAQKMMRTIAMLEKKVQSFRRPKEGRLITHAQREQLKARFYENAHALSSRVGIELWADSWDED